MIIVVVFTCGGTMVAAQALTEREQFAPIVDPTRSDYATSADLSEALHTAEQFSKHAPCKGYKMIVTPGPGMGMTNQFDLIVNAIFLGVKTGRNVCVQGFRPQFDRHAMLHLGWVLDLHLINKLIHRYMGQFGNNSIVLAQATIENIRESTCYAIHGPGTGNGPRNCWGSRKFHNVHNIDVNFTALLPFLLDYDNVTETVALTAGFPLYQHLLGAKYGTNGTLSDDDKCLQLIRNILRFNPVFYDTAATIKEIAGIPVGANYTALHFRLEDDALDNLYVTTWWAYEELPHVVAQKIKFQWSKPEFDIFVFAKYLDFVKRFIPADEQIYICSGIGKNKIFTQRLDFTLELLRSYFKNLRVGDMHYVNQRGQAYVSEVAISGREVEAIVDYIIGIESNSFVGIKYSSFSVSVARQLAQRDISYHLFDVENAGLPEILPSTVEELDSLLTVDGVFNGTDIVSRYKAAMVGRKKLKTPFHNIQIP
jgi:hypothetical protein